MASFDPVGWLISLAGCVSDWFLTRSWVKILLRMIPVALLGGLVLVVWLGGQMDRDALFNKYLEIGSPEIDQWEDQLFEKLAATTAPTDAPVAPAAGSPAANPSDAASPNPTSTDSNSPDTNSQVTQTTGNPPESGESNPELANNEGEKPSDPNALQPVSTYGEMLFRRLELLRSNPQSQFVIGTNLLLKGAPAAAQKVLSKVAPDDKEGLPKAHVIMAMLYLDQFLKTRDQSLVPVLQHHADIATTWGNTPKEVLMLAADLNWQRGKRDRSMEIVASAAERFPELYPVLRERASVMGDQSLAESSREKAISYFQRKLEEEPKNDVVRIQIAQLLGSEDDALDQSERLLKEGMELEPTKNLSRALSEINRIRFTKVLVEKQGKVDDFSLLEQALEIDPTNPSVAEQVARLLRDDIRPSRKLQTALRDLLASGEVTIGTHATMSEYYLAANRRAEAIMHLEKVFQAAPTEIKFANNLAYLYAVEGRMDEAEQTARKCLELVQRGNVQNQRFLDELLDTLGMIYQKQDKTSDAISSYELALRFNPERIDSRQRLAAIYREMGNEGVAAAHEQAIESIQKSQKERAEQGQPQAPQQTPPIGDEPVATGDKASPDSEVESPPEDQTDGQP